MVPSDGDTIFRRFFFDPIASSSPNPKERLAREQAKLARQRTSFVKADLIEEVAA